jgi:hypothetical protein
MAEPTFPLRLRVSAADLTLPLKRSGMKTRSKEPQSQKKHPRVAPGVSRSSAWYGLT